MAQTGRAEQIDNAIVYQIAELIERHGTEGPLGIGMAQMRVWNDNGFECDLDIPGRDANNWLRVEDIHYSDADLERIYERATQVALRQEAH